MNAGDLFQKLGVILDEIKRLDEENPTGPDEETDPRIVKLLDEASRIQNRLDPLVRRKIRHDPAALAEWDEIMHMCDDLDEADSAISEASPIH